MNRRHFIQSVAAATGCAYAAPRRPIQPWFHKDGLGLFLHWGPCSVGQVEIGWSMYRSHNRPNPYWPPEKYNALADRFDPQEYDPDRWLAAAAKAGFKYTALTVRHHDGYALWPSQYGAFGTRQKMKGRDLVRPFVEACRKNGLKVGFYYSPTDWNFCPEGWPHRSFPRRDPFFLATFPEKTLGMPKYVDMPPAELQKYADVFYAYLKGQIGELLTRYGKIDLLWWDGWDWPGGIDLHGQAMTDFVRKLQPEIVQNDRYAVREKGLQFGDYNTDFEARDPAKRPDGAWEQCDMICGGWSYKGEKALCKSAAQMIERFVRDRAWGGNYLPDFGPRADGTMSPKYYAICEELAAWMKYGAESVFDVEAGPYPAASDVPVTCRRNTWYLHFLSRQQRTATLSGVGTPSSAKVLRTGASVPWKKDRDRVVLTLPSERLADIDEVVTVLWT